MMIVSKIEVKHVDLYSILTIFYVILIYTKLSYGMF